MPITFLVTRKAKRIPVDATSVLEGDVLFDPKRHIAHWATCETPDRFRRPQPPQPEQAEQGPLL